MSKCQFCDSYHRSEADVADCWYDRLEKANAEIERLRAGLRRLREAAGKCEIKEFLEEYRAATKEADELLEGKP